MKKWHVEATALGGPMGEFASRRYQVEAETAGQAADKAISVFGELLERWNDAQARSVWYRFSSVSVRAQASHDVELIQ